MATVLVADQIAEQGIARLRERHDAVVRTGLSEDELVEAVADVAGIIVRSQTRITERIIEAAPQLAVIGRAGVGVDNIDLEAATARGVVVVNAPLSNTISAIEHALALLLAVARNVPQGHASLREGRWERSKLQGVELAGHTLGIVGLGRIGTGVAQRARAFEMRVVAHDPFVSSERAASIGVELVSLDALLEQSDFVTLHTALHEETRGLISSEQLARMKPGAYLVNTARGALVDEQALHEAVEGGVIAGAAIDVFSEEPAIGNVLTTTEGIVVTPHLAASTAEAQDRAAVDVVDEVLAVLAGRPARFAVNAPLVDPETMAIIGPYIDAAEVAACVASQLQGGQLAQLRIDYLGEIANHETGPLRAAAIVGVLERVSSRQGDDRQRRPGGARARHRHRRGPWRGSRALREPRGRARHLRERRHQRRRHAHAGGCAHRRHRRLRGRDRARRGALRAGARERGPAGHGRAGRWPAGRVGGQHQLHVRRQRRRGPGADGARHRPPARRLRAGQPRGARRDLRRAGDQPHLAAGPVSRGG